MKVGFSVRKIFAFRFLCRVIRFAERLFQFFKMEENNLKLFLTFSENEVYLWYLRSTVWLLSLLYICYHCYQFIARQFPLFSDGQAVSQRKYHLAIKLLKFCFLSQWNQYGLPLKLQKDLIVFLTVVSLCRTDSALPRFIWGTVLSLCFTILLLEFWYQVYHYQFSNCSTKIMLSS